MISTKLTLLTTLFLITKLHGVPEKDFMHAFDNIALIECNQNSLKITSLVIIKGERINLNLAHEEFGHMIFSKLHKRFPEKYKKCLILDKKNTQKEYRKLIWINGIEFVTQDYGRISLNKLLNSRHKPANSSSQ